MMGNGYDNSLSEEQKRARERIHELIVELRDLLGPCAMVEADGGDDEEIEEAKGSIYLREWVLVTNWIGSDPDGYIIRLNSEGLPKHHASGLLDEANSYGI